MKKTILLALMILGLAHLETSGQSANYVQESAQITTFLKAHIPAGATLNFTFNANVPAPAAADVVKFEGWLKATATALAKDKESIRSEFTYLVFLMLDKDPADLKKAAATFPANFLLTSGDPVGLGNAALGSTSFDNLQASIIYGITDFVISRAKQELVEVYLSDWDKKLHADKIIEPLIPNTLSVFDAFNNSNSISLASYGDKWKTAFQEDLRNIPLRLESESYIDLILAKGNIPNSSEIGPAIAGGDSLIYQLYLKNHIVNILSDMSARYIKENKPAYFKRLAVMSDVLLSAGGKMDDKNKTYSPVTVSELKNMDIDSWHIFLKLLYIRKNTQLNYAVGAADLDTFVGNFVTGTNADDFIALFKQTTTIITNYQLMIIGTAAQASKSLTFDDTRKLVDVSFQLVDNMADYKQLFKPDQAAKTEYETNVKPYFTYLSQIGEGISTQQYPKVLDGTISVIRKISSSAVADANGNVPVVLNQTVDYLQKYGSFMLNILSAKSGTDVEAALDELVPKGDYKLKNAPSVTVSLSALPGVFLGFETISKFKADASTGLPLAGQPKESSTAFSPGGYLPIGIDMNWGHKAAKSTDAKPVYNSWGLMLQVLDLGAGQC